MGQFITRGDPLATLSQLPDEQLFGIAKNESADHKELAVKLLVERSSLFAGRPEISYQAKKLILDNPLVLKKVDPSAGMHALRLPGVIDVLADAQAKRQALERVVGENNATHNEQITALTAAVTANKTSAEYELRTAYSVLWRDATHKAFKLTEDIAALKLAVDAQLAEVRELHAEDVAAATERLRLLERSTWRKLVDWYHARRARSKNLTFTVTDEGDEAHAIELQETDHAITTSHQGTT